MACKIEKLYRKPTNGNKLSVLLLVSARKTRVGLIKPGNLGVISHQFKTEIGECNQDWLLAGGQG